MRKNGQPTQEEMKKAIQTAILTSDTSLIKAIKVVYGNQTAYEKTLGITETFNKVGFSGFHAQIMTSFAKQIARWEAEKAHAFNSPLSPRQKEIARKIMVHYWKQLVPGFLARLAEQKAAEADMFADCQAAYEAERPKNLCFLNETTVPLPAPKPKAPANLCGKTRPASNPYEIWTSFDGAWVWKVLKKYQSPEAEAKNFYARWYCLVSSPCTMGDGDFGDVYVREIKQSAVRTA